MSLYERLALKFFQNLPAETAHDFSINCLKYGLVPKKQKVFADNLKVNIAGLEFNNPVGFAAGYDKNAKCLKALSSQGFGFIEAGTVTPKPQKGNPKPRLHRIKAKQALINSLGFNNLGLDVFAKNLQKYRAKQKDDYCKIGVNIGKNKDTEDIASDYITCLEKLYEHADYVTVNISSPNTANLRDIQNVAQFEELIEKLFESRLKLMKDHGNRAIFFKLAPDLSEKQISKISALALKYNLDGLIISNTTITRPPDEVQGFGKRDDLFEISDSDIKAKDDYKSLKGGLSGAPLFKLSTQVLKQFSEQTKKKIPLIGVGGIMSAEDAHAKIKAGASLVQVYTGLIYKNFDLVRDINKYLGEKL